MRRSPGSAAALPGDIYSSALSKPFYRIWENALLRLDRRGERNWRRRSEDSIDGYISLPPRIQRQIHSPIFCGSFEDGVIMPDATNDACTGGSAANQSTSGEPSGRPLCTQSLTACFSTSGELRLTGVRAESRFGPAWRVLSQSRRDRQGRLGKYRPPNARSFRPATQGGKTQQISRRR